MLCPHLRFFRWFKSKPLSPIGPKRILDSLRKSSPDLRVLKLEAVALDSLCLLAVGALKRLEEITVKYPDGDQTAEVDIGFLLNISARPTLRQLSLEGKQLKIVLGSTSCIVHGPIHFPALEFDCSLTMATVIKLLRCATFPVLRNLWMCLYAAEMPDDAFHWHQFFDVIGNVTTKCFNALQLVHLRGTLSPGCTFSFLPGLSSLSLTTFIFNAPIFNPICRYDIATIINTWPLLDVLSVSFGGSSSSKLEFSILIDIAIGLPRLKHLQLSLDCHSLPDLDDIPIRSHDLHSLHLLIHPNPRQACNIAQIVDRLFPNLKQPLIYRNPGDSAIWGEVQDLIPILQKARKHESTRIKSGNIQIE